MADYPDDLQLMQAISKGDQTAYAVIVRRYASQLLRFAKRYLRHQADAEDVLQETLLRVWLKAPQWQPQLVSPRSWFYQIAYHLCIDHMRRRKRLAEDQTDDDVVSEVAPEQNILQQESIKQVYRLMGDLPERQRSALFLCALEGLSNKEAAAVLDVSTKALESLLSRARRSLRQQFIEESVDE